MIAEPDTASDADDCGGWRVVDETGNVLFRGDIAECEDYMEE